MRSSWLLGGERVCCLLVLNSVTSIPHSMYCRRRKSPLILPEVVMTVRRKKKLRSFVVVLIVVELRFDSGMERAVGVGM